LINGSIVSKDPREPSEGDLNMQGLLEVSGTIDLNQFWPVGESDADTTKIIVQAEAFRFRPHPGSALQVTHAFDDAMVRGSAGSKPAVDTKGRVTIRLQGIDAPELHYRPRFPTKLTGAKSAAFKSVNGNFRQPYGETATVHL